MKKIWNQFNLSKKFTFIIVTFSLIPFITLFLYSNKMANSDAIVEKERSLQEKVLLISEQSEKTLDLANLSSEVIKSSTSINDYLSRLKNSDSISLEDKLAFQHHEIKNLEKIIITNPYLHHIRIYSRFSDIDEMYPILYTPDRSPYIFNKYYENEWILNHKEHMGFGIEEYPLMSLVNSIVVNDEIVAVLEVSVAMQDVFPDLYKESGSNDYLIRSDNSFIGEYDKASAPVLKKIQSVEGVERVRFNTTKDFLVMNLKLKEFNASYISVVSLKALNVQILQRTIIIIIFSSVFSFLLILIVRVFSDQLLTEMYDIFESIKTFANGNLSIRPKTYEQKEMKDFAKQVDTMFEKTVALISDNVEKETAEKNAQIKALQSQINAHFIYNVLENIKMMAEIEGNYEVADSITSLGSLLHYSMHWENSVVTLEKELKYVEDYLDLMRLRLNFQLDLHLNIPKHLRNHPMPKLLIQPLVENAIIHGLEQQEDDTILRIQAMEYKDSLVIQVTDYGAGIDHEKLDKVKEGLKQKIDIDDKGIGLANVTQRIQIIYGNDYGLDIISEHHLFTTVLIYIPLERKKGEYF